jgi:hypothetical protein
MKLCLLLAGSAAGWRCGSPVTREAWGALVPFLQAGGGLARPALCRLQLGPGNYTGEVGDEGLPHGWGEMRWSNGSRYGPDLAFYYSAGDRYLGQWAAGLQQGVGTLFSRTGVYVGSWEGGVQEGNGTALYNNGNKYKGEFRDGFKQGQGVFEVANGDVYSGEFVAGKRDGAGIETFWTGERYVGDYRADLQEGQGTAYYATGQVKYVGEWRGGSPHGNGTYIALNGDRWGVNIRTSVQFLLSRYVGGFRAGVVVGPGAVYETNGNIRFLQHDQTIQFRSQANKYIQLVRSLTDYIGLSDRISKFLQKYFDFYNDYLLPTLLSYLPFKDAND